MHWKTCVCAKLTQCLPPYRCFALSCRPRSNLISVILPVYLLTFLLVYIHPAHYSYIGRCDWTLPCQRFFRLSSCPFSFAPLFGSVCIMTAASKGFFLCCYHVLLLWLYFSLSLLVFLNGRSSRVSYPAFTSCKIKIKNMCLFLPSCSFVVARFVVLNVTHKVDTTIGATDGEGSRSRVDLVCRRQTSVHRPSRQGVVAKHVTYISFFTFT